MDNNFQKKINEYIALFDDWADAIFINVDQEFIKNTTAENKIYKTLTTAFQNNNVVN